jgi:predicted NACHT family NTPase
LLPLLDGLDELASERQEKCVQAINHFLESEDRSLYLVVCSRFEEYLNYETQLHLMEQFAYSLLLIIKFVTISPL